MLKYKFKVGDKVVPTKKSVGCSLENSPELYKAKKINRPYLYILSLPLDVRRISCNDITRVYYVLTCGRDPNKVIKGDYFAEGDFELYEPQ